MSEKKWSADLYRKAAYRHLNVCIFLENHLSEVKGESEKNIVSDIFYLSGYIVECILKFCILQIRHLQKKMFSLEEIEDLKLKTHDLNSLWDMTVNEGKISRKDMDVWSKQNELLKKWDVDCRYMNQERDFFNKDKVINCFDNNIKKIFNTINDRY